MIKSFEKIDFYSEDIKLTGYIHLPSEKPESFVIGSHGLLSDGNSGKQIDLAQNLMKNNIGYLRFHHRGCAESDGDLQSTDLSTRRCDLKAAFQFLKKNFNPLKTGLFGSSMGGATCIFSSHEIDPHALVLLASPVVGSSMEDSFSGSIDILMKETGLPKEFFIRNINFNLEDKIPELKNTLVIHGDNDEIVPFKNGETLFAKAGQSKKFIRLENGNHRVEDPEHQKIFIREATHWFFKHLKE